LRFRRGAWTIGGVANDAFDDTRLIMEVLMAIREDLRYVIALLGGDENGEEETQDDA